MPYDREVPIDHASGEHSPHEEHRHRVRRSTDVAASDLEKSLTRAEKNVGRLANLIKSGGVIVGLVVSVMIWFSAQLLGPINDAIRDLKANDGIFRRELSELERVTRLNTLLNCIQLRKTDPSLVPSECNDPNLLRRN